VLSSLYYGIREGREHISIIILLNINIIEERLFIFVVFSLKNIICLIIIHYNLRFFENLFIQKFPTLPYHKWIIIASYFNSYKLKQIFCYPRYFYYF